MRLLPEGKSKALSAAALAAAAVCAAMSVKALLDLGTLLEVIGTPAFRLSLVRSTLPVEMPPLAAFIARNMRLFFSFLVLFWLSGLALSLGVWARREWARRGAAAWLFLLSGAALLTLFFPWLVVPRPLEIGGVPLAPEFNSMVKTAAFLLRTGSLMGSVACFAGAAALERGPSRAEFH